MEQENSENYIEIGNQLYEEQEYNQALKYYSKATNHYQTENNINMQAESHLKTGNTYFELKNYPEALNQYNNALKLYKNINNGMGSGYSQTGIALTYQKQGEHEQARHYYYMAVNTFEQLKDYKRAGIVEKLIAETYQIQEDWENAEIDYQRSREDFRQIDDKKHLNEIEDKTKELEKERAKKTRYTPNVIISLSAYLLLLIIAEYTVAFKSVQIGLIIEIIILFALLIQSSITKNKNLEILLRSMMALPIIRLIGLSVPLMQIPTLYWYPIIAIPLFATTFIIMRSQGLNRKNIGIIWGNLPIQLLIATTGILLGSIEYLILHPKPLISVFNLENLIIASIILIVSTGFAEELLFRGILQKNAQNVLSIGLGLLYSALLFTAMHIGWQSFPDLIFVFTVGIFYGYCFYKTRSILGTTLSHGISNTFLFIIIPFYTPILYTIINTITQTI